MERSEQALCLLRNVLVLIEADAVDISRELARGKFTDEKLEDMRSRIGLELRTDAATSANRT